MNIQTISMNIQTISSNNDNNSSNGKLSSTCVYILIVMIISQNDNEKSGKIKYHIIQYNERKCSCSCKIMCITVYIIYIHIHTYMYYEGVEPMWCTQPLINHLKKTPSHGSARRATLAGCYHRRGGENKVGKEGPHGGHGNPAVRERARSEPYGCELEPTRCPSAQDRSGGRAHGRKTPLGGLTNQD